MEEVYSDEKSLPNSYEHKHGGGFSFPCACRSSKQSVVGALLSVCVAHSVVALAGGDSFSVFSNVSVMGCNGGGYTLLYSVCCSISRSLMVTGPVIRGWRSTVQLMAFGLKAIVLFAITH